MSSGSSANRLVLVTGAGRSGTSTVAGTLHFLGLHVPLPVLQPNESNPQGFFESTWPLWFHRRLMDRALIAQTDARPEAFDKMADAVTPEIRAELRGWLAEVAAESSEVVVKDPRSLWVAWLWEEVAADLGIEIGFLTMVRHPAEVVGSRATYYGGKSSSDDAAWKFAVGNLAAWVNGNLLVERQTRGKRRAVVRYNDLISDWRSVIGPVGDTFGLGLDTGTDSDGPRRVDDFIDPDLRRHEPTWEGLGMPDELVGVAEGVWDAMGRLADSRGADEDAAERMDEMSARYATLMRNAQAIARDASSAQARAARAKAEEETTATMQAKVDKARANARRAREDAAAAAQETFGRRLDRALRRRVPEPVKQVVRKVRR